MSEFPGPEGDMRAWLEATRDRIVAELGRADSSAAVASLSKQLVDVVGRIDALPVKEASAVDDLAAKRAARREAGVPDASADGGQRRARSDGAGGKRGSAS